MWRRPAKCAAGRTVALDPAEELTGVGSKVGAVGIVEDEAVVEVGADTPPV